MGDSGHQIGECDHGRTRVCVDCLIEEVENLRKERDEYKNIVRQNTQMEFISQAKERYERNEDLCHKLSETRSVIKELVEKICNHIIALEDDFNHIKENLKNEIKE